MMKSRTEPRTFLEPIQWLRGFAALSVAIGHTLNESKKIDGFEETANLLRGLFPYQIGVDIFFVISGFIMVHATDGWLDEPGAQWRFAKARVSRVVPLYWFYTLLLAMVALIAPSVLDTASFDTKHLISSLTFIPGLFDAPDRPLLKLGWTLNFEMFFYLVFFISIILVGWRAPILAALIIIAMVLVNYFGTFKNQPWRFWASSIIIEFCYGVGIGLLYLRNLRFGTGTALALVFVATAFLWLTVSTLEWNNRFLVLGIPAMLVVLVCACVRTTNSRFRSRTTRFFAAIGDASYTLYLLHPFIISAMFLLARFFDLSASVYLLSTLILIVIGSLVAYRWIELPLLRVTRWLLSPYGRPR